MPIYQYRDQMGRVVELRRAVAERDDVPANLRRVTVPARVGLCGSLAPICPTDADAAVPRAFREYELSGKSAGAIEKETGFSRDHIRRVWNF